MLNIVNTHKELSYISLYFVEIRVIRFVTGIIKIPAMKVLSQGWADNCSHYIQYVGY